MNYKNRFLKLILLIGIALGIIITINYLLDPFQQFRINPYMRGEQRKVNPGIARNYKFDSLVIGTSTSQNVLKKDIEEKFGVSSAVNLSMSGSTQTEQEALLKLAFKHNDVKLVIYGMDMFSYVWDPGTFRSRIPDYLYNEDKLLKMKYLLNVETLNKGLSGFRRALKKKQDINWIEKYNYHTDNGEYNSKHVYETSKADKEGIRILDYNSKNMCFNFDNFLRLAEKNKSIEYKIYFVPYTMLWWYYADKYNKLNDILEFKKYVAKKIKEYPNIELYEFQNDLEIVDDENYKDILHINPKKSEEIIENIRIKKGLVNSENYNIKINKFKENLEKSKEKYKKLGL